MKVQAGYETASHADRQLDHHYKLRLPAQLAARPGLKHGTDRLASRRMDQHSPPTTMHDTLN